MRRIVYTRPDGGVNVCCPSPDAIAWMGCGGFWADQPRGFMDVQIERMIARGIPADVARRYAHAMQFGGCTTAEAYEIIRDRDCGPYGTGFELWDASELPDRWYRDAWTRSHNGGPINIDLGKARKIQWKRAHDFVATENKKRAESFDLERQIEPDWPSFRTRLLSARDDAQLRSVWIG